MILGKVQPTDFASIPDMPVLMSGRRPSERRESSWSPAEQYDAPASSPWPTHWRALDDVALMTLPDPEWLVEGIIPKLARVGIYAPPNTAKTTLIAGLAVAIATGREWFGHAVQNQGGCIYVPTEDISGFKVRLASAKQQARLDSSKVCGIYTHEYGLDLIDPVSVGQFIAFWKAQGGAYVLVVIDTLSGAMPGANENAIEAMGLAMAHAKQIMLALGVTVILLHHTNASATRERGHSVVRCEADTMIALEPVDDVVCVENNKQRNGAYFPSFDLKLVPLGKSVVLRLAKDVPVVAGILADTQRRLLAVLRDDFTTDGATKGEWERSGVATGMSSRTFHRGCKVLTERGYVSTAGKQFRVSASGAKVLGA